MLHSNGQTTRVEYREDVKVRDIDLNEESIQGRAEKENYESLEENKSQ